MRRQCRKIAALTLAHGITAEFRWVATNRNMADQPSRGRAAPGPCESGPSLRTSTGRSSRAQCFDNTASEGAQELPPAAIGLEQMLERVGIEPLLAHRIAADA